MSSSSSSEDDADVVGVGRSNWGMEFVSACDDVVEEKDVVEEEVSSVSDEEEVVPMSNQDFQVYGKSRQKSIIKDRIKKWEETLSTNETETNSPKTETELAEQDFAKFTKHSSNFALNYMKKFGFKSRLGKDESGIVNPVKAHQSSVKRGGLGIDSVGKPIEQDEDEFLKKRQEELREQRMEQMNSWRRTDKMSAIDKEPPSILPELVHNFKVLLNVSKSRLELAENKREEIEEKLEKAREEKNALENVISEKYKSSEQVENLQNLIQKLSLESNDSDIFHQYFQEICDNFSDDILQEFNVFALVPRYVFPLLIKELEPLSFKEKITKIVQMCHQWSLILLTRYSFSTNASLVERLILQVFIPCLDLSNLDLTNHNNADHILVLIERIEDKCSELVSKLLIDFIVLGHIQTRLISLIESWESDSDALPLHLIVFPWLPVLHRAERVYSSSILDSFTNTVKKKLNSLLKNWKYGDDYLPNSLAQWKHVVHGEELHSLVKENIIPIVVEQLSLMKISSSGIDGQDFTGVNCLLEWEAYFGIERSVKMLLRNVMYRWIHSLVEMLENNFKGSMIRDWYMKWKKVLPDRIYSHPKMETVFKHALFLIQFAVEGKSLTQLENAVQYSLYMTNYGNSTKSQSKSFPANDFNIPISNTPNLSETIHQLAEQKGIEFTPQPHLARVNGKQIYRFANVYIYMERHLIHYKRTISSSQWTAVSISDLLEIIHQ